MSDSFRARVDAIFDRALDVPVSERAAFLIAACGGDLELLGKVDALLRLADKSEADVPADFSSGPIWQQLFEDAERTSRLRSQIGPWRLLDEIGRGGMGTVYLAERVDGAFDQRVALKLMHGAVATEDAIRRFEQERQILASLTHPGIARLFDGGRTAEGLPYIVMEFVEGLTIDRHCDAHRLGIADRLRLFVKVGQAVEHAHRNLVVHRDLKPSNIVVADSGDVKLLDFGIAKLLQPPDAVAPLTRTLSRVLTPEYASPEQVQGGPITVASDVYQLGLLLYELIAGLRPYRLTSASVLEIERVVCHEEPRRPSTAVEAAGNDRSTDVVSLAAVRGSTPRHLVRDLRGDLDAIVSEALRKPPERRYPSVERLIEDVERHLEGRPVAARGDTPGYRAARFAARHRLAVTTAALVFALVTGWALTATWQASAIARERDRARVEATKAQQVKDFVLRLFQSADPGEARGEDISARELLDRGWSNIEHELAGQPEVQVEILDTVGQVYRELGAYDRADSRLNRAVELAKSLGPDHPMVARTLRSDGRLARDRGQYDTAEAQLRESLERFRTLSSGDGPEVATTLHDLALTLYARGRFDQATPLFREALDMRRRLFGADHLDVADSLGRLGMALRNQGDYKTAEPLLRESLEQRRRLLPADHPRIATSLSDLALAVQNLGDLEAAEALYREAIDIMVRVRGSDHPYVAVTMNNLARLLRSRGHLADAETMLRRALEIRRRTFGERHPQVAMNLSDLGRLLYDRGDLREAERLYRDAIEMYAPDHPWRAATVFNMGRVLEDRRDYRGAEALYRQALASQRAQYGEDHERVAIDLRQIGIVQHRQGDRAGAERSLRQAVDIFRKRLPEDHPRIAEALVPLGDVLLDCTDDGRAHDAAAPPHSSSRKICLPPARPAHPVRPNGRYFTASAFKMR